MPIAYSTLRKVAREIFINYVFCIVLLFVVAFIFLKQNATQPSDILFGLKSLSQVLISNPLIWLVLLIPWLIFKLIQFVYQGYQTGGFTRWGKRSFVCLALPVLGMFFGKSFLDDYTHSEQYAYQWLESAENKAGVIFPRFDQDSLQRGIHLFGRRGFGSEEIAPIVKNNIEWITLVPYGWQESISSTQIGRSERSYTTLTHRDSVYIHQINELKTHKFKVMLKPHIWMHSNGDGWRSDIAFNNDQDWLTWKNNYQKFILHYARIAALTNCEQFCIGTELHQVVKTHPDYWRYLIKEIRAIYPGKLTYAANWYQEVEDVSFWDDLDFIGIQAYYPLCNEKSPTLKSLMKGWKKHIDQIEKYHLAYNRPVLFTELGYKSTTDSAKEPWAWVNNVPQFTKVSYETQANCYEAFFRSFWNKPWFAGVHLWEWRAGSRNNRGRSEINFTPQHKPAENIMAKWYGFRR